MWQSLPWACVPEEQIASTVGSGDASFAGAICAMARGLRGREALRLAMACGVANAMLGEVGSIQLGDVNDVMKKVDVESITE